LCSYIGLTVKHFKQVAVGGAALGTGNNVMFASNKNITAGEIIGMNKKGSISREFPNEWRNSTLNDIKKAAKNGDQSARKAKKLLEDKRFDKTDNRK
jgi:fumarate hydratase class II